MWPRGDDFDRKVAKLWAPATLNFLIIPFVGAVDVFWVGHMANATALAGQGAAVQVFSSAFWVISFLPSLITPLVAKEVASMGGPNDARGSERVQRVVGEAIVMASVIGLFGMTLMTTCAGPALSLVGVAPGTEVASHAVPYVFVRALTFIPAVASTVAFATFRGTMDVVTPLMITVAAQLLNLLLDPVFIFGLGPVAAFGVAGAAVATAFAELTSFGCYMTLLLKRGLLSLSALRIPPWERVRPLLAGGVAVQIRSIALNLVFLAVTSATLSMDSTGTMAAAHTLTQQLWQLGGIVLLSLGSIASVLIAQTFNAKEGGGVKATKKVGDRMLALGLVFGCALGVMQLATLPLLSIFTPLQDVQAAARTPALLCSMLHALSGMVFVGEGIMQGNQAFEELAVSTATATGLMLIALHFFGGTLNGVWCSFFVFNSARLVGMAKWWFVDSDFAPRKVSAAR